MRVDKKGGACVCPTCGAHCEGRFEACGPILEQPGYVPMTAPTWAIDCVDPPAPQPALPRVARHDADASMSAPATDQSSTVDQAHALRAVGPALSELRDELLGAIADVRRDLAGRDQQLADAYSNLSESYAKLSTAAEEERDMARAVVEGLARVARRVGRLEKTLLGAQPPP
ncbi:MAG: hypothetical protein MUP67_13560 [Acidimicrobiia bacterium]|nr:hypothetical protein [Acidimicrobiia bacterium]